MREHDIAFSAREINSGTQWNDTFTLGVVWLFPKLSTLSLYVIASQRAMAAIAPGHIPMEKR